MLIYRVRKLCIRPEFSLIEGIFGVFFTGRRILDGDELNLFVLFY